jgi:putative effector of murein hydrolase LrgA (UPF0299 family)
MRMGMGMGTQQGVSSTPAVFTVANANGSKSITLKTSVTTTLTVTGDVTIGSSADPNGTTMQVTSSATTVYFKGTSGTIVCDNAAYITHLYLNGTGTTIAGSINGMALTYLYLYGTGIPITGSINGMALTTLLINGTGIPITGSINGMALTYLYLYGTGIPITGSINGMALTTLLINGTGIPITGSINGMALTFLYLYGTGTNITGSINGMALTELYLIGTGTSITGYGSLGYLYSPTIPNKSFYLTSVTPDENQTTIPTLTMLTGGNNKTFSVSVSGLDITVQLATDGSGNSTTTAKQIVSGWTEAAAAVASIALFAAGSTVVTSLPKTYFVKPFGTITTINLSGNPVATTTQAGYRGLLLQAAAKAGSTLALTITDNTVGVIPAYAGDNDQNSNQQCSTAWGIIKGKSGAKSVPANWYSAGYS